MDIEVDAQIEGSLAAEASLVVLDTLELLVQTVSMVENLQSMLGRVSHTPRSQTLARSPRRRATHHLVSFPDARSFSCEGNERASGNTTVLIIPINEPLPPGTRGPATSDG